MTDLREALVEHIDRAHSRLIMVKALINEVATDPEAWLDEAMESVEAARVALASTAPSEPSDEEIEAAVRAAEIGVTTDSPDTYWGFVAGYRAARSPRRENGS